MLESDIAEVLAETGLRPALLELEITDSILVEGYREHSDALLGLRKTGVTIAIDDFGTGYSSRDYLRQFPGNRIRLAQPLVENIESAPGAAAIVRATIGLAHELRTELVANGVETPRQLALLRNWGYTYVQSFHLASPPPAADPTELLRNGGIIETSL